MYRWYDWLTAALVAFIATCWLGLHVHATAWLLLVVSWWGGVFVMWAVLELMSAIRHFIWVRRAVKRMADT